MDLANNLFPSFVEILIGGLIIVVASRWGFRESVMTILLGASGVIVCVGVIFFSDTAHAPRTAIQLIVVTAGLIVWGFILRGTWIRTRVPVVGTRTAQPGAADLVALGIVDYPSYGITSRWGAGGEMVIDELMLNVPVYFSMMREGELTDFPPTLAIATDENGSIESGRLSKGLESPRFNPTDGARIAGPIAVSYQGKVRWEHILKHPLTTIGKSASGGQIYAFHLYLRVPRDHEATHQKSLVRFGFELGRGRQVLCISIEINPSLLNRPWGNRLETFLKVPG